MMRSAAQHVARRASTSAAASGRRTATRSAVLRCIAPSSRLVQRGAKFAPSAQHLSACFSTSAADDTAAADRHEFQAETRQLLDIVTHSIYTDKEVFIRELISNASDALEKLRHLQSTGESIQDAELEPMIVITTDEKAGTLTIADTGVGMSKDELIENLGTIARSGSKAFLEQLKESSPGESGDALGGIIGKFGVGFYSAFMVADKVEVYSQSAVSGRQSHLWRSDGSGSYEVAEADDVTRGSKIVIHLKDSCKEFGTKSKVESIIRRYSNFVSFPIVLDGDTVNTVQALWTKSESEVTDEEYTEFYKFIANAFDEPAYRVIFKADAPIELKTLFFIGTSHTEKFGYSRLEPGVSLYSRKVLIERNSPDILPDWMRFVRGVVDSEDLPLSLSREKMQDSRLIHKIRDVLTRRIIRFLERESTKEPEKFEKFFKEFGQFVKEGICTDFANKDALAKLLRYESSQVDEGKLTTLDEYVSRCPPDQNEIYYLCAPTRAIAESSPYFEAFKKMNKEVLFVYSPIDDFVMTNIAEFNGRKVISAEHAKVDVVSDDNASGKKLSKDEQDLFGAWLKLTLEDNVKEVKFTSRLTDSPAIIVDHESASIRKMMQMVNDRAGQDMSGLSKNVMEINLNHSIIVDLNALREVNDALAKKVARQIYTNATVAAGLVEDGRTILGGLNEILAELLEQSLQK
ncbi:heat shock protein 75 kDa, mitochondrial precursor [Phytophthora infestans T30-4]|uniref:Heat shock protein 75 kDa, mitochondrial n=1 Tax=Phytophthora infestans (strain T30-4) TaxID=403677 RepID=D0N336_PHYIT|nr:heat shock protein 75 kDa, mitochondrial precursor [Phytophthora infestans T30-4]EEY69328.1 heat shock protein 75 kDa, mitochondrial precursor [Phytophthora infestans T30-4]|eukprot:XP_002999182.1 heat shock protein 75 kDa, mitochondrial precursor [Phytophthora infestans T30-4]